MNRWKWIAVAIVGCVGVSTSQAGLVPGYTVLTTEHADVGIGYEEGAWDLHEHDDINDIEYAANEVLNYVAPAAALSQPTGSQWAFLGAGAGNPVWLLPQVNDPNLLWLGIGGEEIESGIFVNDQVTLNLVDVRGPGQFSLFSNGVFGDPNVLMATSDGISSADTMTVFVGSHAHYNWAFTAAGYYEIDFEAVGTLVDGNVVTSSGPVTYYFGVETTAVPEASSLTLAAAAIAISAVGMRRLRKRSQA
jgi:surface-anchored protein